MDEKVTKPTIETVLERMAAIEERTNQRMDAMEERLNQRMDGIGERSADVSTCSSSASTQGWIASRA